MNAQLEKAIRAKDTIKIRSLVSQGADVNWKNADGWPMIYLATVRSCPTVVKTPLQLACHINASPSTQLNHLYVAISQKHSKMSEEWDKIVNPHFPDIVDQLKPGAILIKLLQKRIIKAGEFSRLQKLIDNKSEEYCNMELLTTVLNKRGPNSVKEFVELLKDTNQQHIANLLAQTQVQPRAEDKTKGQKALNQAASNQFVLYYRISYTNHEFNHGHTWMFPHDCN
jgi:hypothetical protein